MAKTPVCVHRHAPLPSGARHILCRAIGRPKGSNAAINEFASLLSIAAGTALTAMVSPVQPGPNANGQAGCVNFLKGGWSLPLRGILPACWNHRVHRQG